MNVLTRSSISFASDISFFLKRLYDSLKEFVVFRKDFI